MTCHRHLRAPWILPFIFFLSDCATRQQLAHDYIHAVAKNPTAAYNQKQTIVFFLIDGLSVELTKTLLNSGATPNIRNLFIASNPNFRIGRAVFPSLTHPNISSIITSRNIDQHPIIGNKVWIDGELIEFESPFKEGKLNELIRPYSIFTNLSERKLSSVSVAPYYGDQASARYPLDVEMGLAYKEGNYKFVDQKLIESLMTVLEDTDSRLWPEFIFVHLIGIDSYSHQFGLKSNHVLEHAKFLDEKLGPVFDQLRQSIKKGNAVSAIITADHGMLEMKKTVDLESWIKSAAPTSVVVNQGRLIGLSWPKNMNANQRQAFLTKLSSLPGVEAVASRNKNEIDIKSAKKSYSIGYQDADCEAEGDYALSVERGPFLCPSAADNVSQNFFYPYFATNLATYFRAPRHPDILALAQKGFSFGSSNVLADHGGMTPEEIQVPVLTWNLIIESSEPILRTYQLLESLRFPESNDRLPAKAR